MTVQRAAMSPAEFGVRVARLSYVLHTPAMLRLIAGIVILGGWEIGVRLFAAPFVARPLAIIAAAPSVLGDPAFWSATAASLLAVLIGLLISLVAGTLIGLVIGRLPAADRTLGFWINGFYTMPMVAVLPLLTVWFGYEEASRLATIVFASLFSVVINVADGARSVPPEYLEVGRAYRARPREIWFGITLLSALPYLIAGVRLAAGRALIGTVLAEIFTSVNGLGLYILANARSLHQNEAVVGVLMLCAVGLLFEGLMNWALRRYFPWYRRDETPP